MRQSGTMWVAGTSHRRLAGDPRRRATSAAQLLLVALAVLGNGVTAVVHAQTPFGRDGWRPLAVDDATTRYYYEPAAIVRAGDGRRGTYVGVYASPKENGSLHGFSVDAEVKCGMLYNSVRITSMRLFGKGGPADVSRHIGASPADTDFSRRPAGSAAHAFAKAACGN